MFKLHHYFLVTSSTSARLIDSINAIRFIPEALRQFPKTHLRKYNENEQLKSIIYPDTPGKEDMNKNT